MPSDHDETPSTITYAGFGGAVVCCAILELLGGIALVGELAATIGLSTQIAFLASIGVTGLFDAVAVMWGAE